MDRQTDTGAHRYNRIRGHGSELPPDRGRHQRSITTCLEPGGWGGLRSQIRPHETEKEGGEGREGQRRLCWKERRNLGERQTDPGAVRHREARTWTQSPVGRKKEARGTDRCRDPSFTFAVKARQARSGLEEGELGQTDRQTGEAAGRTAGMMPLSLPWTWSLVRKEKEEEERTRTRGLRDSWKQGWVSLWQTPKPDSPGGKGGGERDLETETDRERPCPCTSTGTTGAGGTDLICCPPGTQPFWPHCSPGTLAWAQGPDLSA